MKFETKVTDIIQRTRNVKSVRFPRPASLNYKPGQFMFVAIKGGGKKLNRHLTISSGPTEKDFIEFTKKLTGSEFSNTLAALKVGDWAEIDAPYGNFTFEGEHKKIGMLSGGIGITPLRSMCRYCTDKALPTKITLLYSCHAENDIVFRGELEIMQKQNPNLRVVLTVTDSNGGWNGPTGRIDADMITREIPDYEETVFYTCGPPAMVEVMVNILKGLGLPKQQIRFENFTGY